MKDRIKVTIEVVVEAKSMFGEDCGGGVAYRYATPDYLKKLIRQEVERSTDYLIVDSIESEDLDQAAEDEKDQYILSLEEENENISANNVALTNRIAELDKGATT